MCNYALTMNKCRQAAGLYQQGYSIRQVAAHFEVSHRAVRSALRLLGVAPRPKLVGRKLRNRMPDVVKAQSSSCAQPEGHAPTGSGQMEKDEA